MINIIIADDHRIFIDGIKTVLANVPDIKITGEALNGKQVLSLLKTRPADVVLLDIRMPVMDGLETAKTI
ncbi:MAG: DNA-binding response regulator, partial [Bacteroidetes bacterium 4484_249]